MKTCLLFFLILGKPVKITDTALVEIRALYEQAAKEKSASEKLGRLLDKVDTLSTPILICYKGASEMVKAKYLFSPFNKMEKFTTGKNLIELAVKRDSTNIEIRFIRFCIQQNLPAFLKYNGNIPRDKAYIISNISNVTDYALKNNIINYMSAPGILTEEEITKLNRQ